MTSFPRSPRLLKGGIVLVDPETAAVKRVISLQYNPDSISRTLQVQGVGDGGDRSQALRLKGPPVETIKIDAEIDATDQLEFPDLNPSELGSGILSSLAALEAVIYPESRRMIENNRLSESGTLEIIPMQSPLTLFIWSSQRIVPVRITEFSVTEDAFDPMLHPIRAKVSLGMRVLSVNDLGFNSLGGCLFMIYQQEKERLAALSKGGTEGSGEFGGFG
jgi:hypothetical protein